MKRVSKEELSKYLSKQIIPHAEHFLDVNLGRPDIWKWSLKEASKTEGLYCDFGSGTHTTPQIADLIPKNKILYAFDSFEGLKEDFSDDHKTGMWIEEGAEQFLNDIHNIKVIKGWYTDTLDNFFKNTKEKISFIHLDCCITSATKYVLDTISKYKKWQVGTIIQFNNIFYTEGEYWYNSDFELFNKMIKDNNLTVKYLAWAGFCHCAYKIVGI